MSLKTWWNNLWTDKPAPVIDRSKVIEVGDTVLVPFCSRMETGTVFAILSNGNIVVDLVKIGIMGTPRKVRHDYRLSYLENEGYSILHKANPIVPPVKKMAEFIMEYDDGTADRVTLPQSGYDEMKSKWEKTQKQSRLISGFLHMV